MYPEYPVLDSRKDRSRRGKIIEPTYRSGLYQLVVSEMGNALRPCCQELRYVPGDWICSSQA